MNIQTLTGPSIGAALAEARRRLGDDIVLVESAAAAEGQPARIRVAVDETAPAAPDAAPPRFGYGAPSRFHPAHAPAHRARQAEKAAVPAGETLSASPGGTSDGFASTLTEIRQMQTALDAARSAAPAAPRQEQAYRGPGGRGRLFPAGGRCHDGARGAA